MPNRAPAPPLLDGLQVFKVLGSPTRLRLLLLLDERGEVAVCDLADAIGLSSSSVSNELALLQRCRLVERRRDGQHVLYRLSAPAASLAVLLRRVCLP